MVNKKIRFTYVQSQPNMQDVVGKVALVTGGASGLGLSIGKALLDNGLKGLVIADANEKDGRTALQGINSKYGDKAIFVQLDVTNKEQFHDAFKNTIDAFKHLDIVINCAGVIKDSEWEKEIKINLTGTITGTILAIENYLPQHRSEDEGVIVNVASTLGFEGFSCLPVFAATMHGIIGIVRSFGNDTHYNRCKVRVMAVCPGFTDDQLASMSDCSFLNSNHQDMLTKEFPQLHKQDVNHVAKTVVDMIRNGKNGSAWIVENNLPACEFEFLNRQQRRK